MGKPDHTESLVLDTLTVAEPSSKKSPVIALVKEPYVTFTANWNEQHRSEKYGNALQTYSELNIKTDTHILL